MTLAPPPQGATRLADWGVIRATGADSAQFLHGQLTQDIEHQDLGTARLAGYCSAKGRLLATFVVWRRGPDEWLLACSADLLTAVLKRLSMFVLRAKCKLSDVSGEVPLWGIAGPASGLADSDRIWAAVARSAGELIRLPDAVPAGMPAVPRYLWAGDPAPALPDLDPQAWRWLEVHSGVARVVAATAEQFVPQMINLELVAGVDFQKGCYPGQEVVARSQYRGTLKRRLFVVGSPAPLHPGQEVFHSADPEQPAGSVVLAGTLAGAGHAALVSIKIAALESGTLHADSATGPQLLPGTLPYALSLEPG